jgi:hypothetical protein
LRLWNLLPDALMWPGSVEGVYIGAQYPLELLLMENEQVIETLATHTSEKALTHGIRSRGVIRCFENFYATRMCNPSEGRPKLAIVIPKQVFRPLSIRRGFPKLLCGPSIGGIACHADIDHPPRVQFDDEESEKRTEEEGSRWEKVAGPDLFGMVAQEDLPILATWSSRTYLSHIFLDCAFTDVKPQLE